MPVVPREPPEAQQAAQPPPEPPGFSAEELAAAGVVGVVGGAVAAQTIQGTAEKAVTTAGAVAHATGLILTAVADYEASALPSDTLVALLHVEYPDVPEPVRTRIVRDEKTYRREFLRKMRVRLKRDLPGALRNQSESTRRERLRTILQRELRYVAAREDAMRARALGRAEMEVLKVVSPEGAVWVMSPDVKNHTPGCVLANGRWFPWEVLRLMHPPTHHGCACRLVGVPEAMATGILPVDAEPPDPAAAMAVMREVMSLDRIQEGLFGEDAELQEAVYGRGEGRRREQERYAKGLVKGGEFKPQRGSSAPVVRWAKVRGGRVRVSLQQDQRVRAGGVEYVSPVGSLDLQRADGEPMTDADLEGNGVVVPSPSAPDADGISHVVNFAERTDEAETADAMRRALEAVARVHSLPPDAPVVHFIGEAQGDGGFAGAYIPHPNSGGAIGVAAGGNPDATNRLHDMTETALHEFGHYIDHSLLGKRPSAYSLHSAASRPGGKLRDVMKAINGTLMVRNWIPQIGDAQTRRYMNKPDEKFARAYTQWIGARSGLELRGVVRAQDRGSSTWYWSEREFEPIGRALDELAVEQGWEPGVRNAEVVPVEAGPAPTSLEQRRAMGTMTEEEEWAEMVAAQAEVDRLEDEERASRPPPITDAEVAPGDAIRSMVNDAGVRWVKDEDGFYHQWLQGSYAGTGRVRFEDLRFGMAGARRAEPVGEAPPRGVPAPKEREEPFRGPIPQVEGPQGPPRVARVQYPRAAGKLVWSKGRGRSTVAKDSAGNEIGVVYPPLGEGDGFKVKFKHPVRGEQWLGQESGPFASVSVFASRDEAKAALQSRHNDVMAEIAPTGSVVPPGLTVYDEEGEVGRRDHITRVEEGRIPTAALANLMGARGEVPGGHRNRRDEAWTEFVADVRANGVKEAIFITVDPGEDPLISEGNHRRDAAIEAGLPDVPVEIRYFGHAQRDGSVLERSRREPIPPTGSAIPPSLSAVPDITTSRGWNQSVARMESQRYPEGAGFVYQGRSDFLLRHGEQMRMKPVPAGIKRGRAKGCYQNAWEVVQNSGGRYRYVEGTAMSYIPIEHAWVYDTQDGRAFDVTWDPDTSPETPDYFGVVFPTALVQNVMLAKGTYGVLDHHDLYRQHFAPEGAERLGPPVPPVLPESIPGVGGPAVSASNLGRWEGFVRFVPGHPVEATNTYGTILVGPKFLELSEDQQEYVVAHEIGHNYDDIFLRDPDHWIWNAEEWRSTDGMLLGGSSETPGERVADAIASIITGDSADLARWPAFLKLAAELRDRGITLPLMDAPDPLLEGSVVRDGEWLSREAYTAADGHWTTPEGWAASEVWAAEVSRALQEGVLAEDAAEALGYGEWVKLEEAAYKFNPLLHPRDRLQRFRDVPGRRAPAATLSYGVDKEVPTVSDTATGEMSETAEKLKAAATYLASVNEDMAQEQNAMGYNKADGWMGLALARATDEWSDPTVVAAAYTMLRKYKKQIASGTGIDFDEIPKPKPPEDEGSARQTARGKLWSAGQKNKASATARAISVKLHEGQFLVKLPKYDATLVQRLKDIPGRRFENGTNFIPAASAAALTRLVEEYGIVIDDPKVAEALSAAAEAAAEKEAETRVALGVPEGVPLPPRRLELDGDMIRMVWPFDRDLLAAVRVVPGARFNKDEKVWYAPVARAGAAVKKLAEEHGFHVSADLQAVLDGAAARIEAKVQASSALEGDYDVPGLNPDLKLYPFQAAGVRYVIEHADGSALIGDEMGLGKTPQAIATLLASNAFPALVAVPNLVKMNWLRELDLWAPNLSITILDGPGVQKKMAVKKHKLAGGGTRIIKTNDLTADVWIVNYEVLGKAKKRIEEQGAAFQAFVADESQYLKNRKAQRTKTAKELAAGRRVKLLLSGTPIVNRPRELAAQLDILGRINEFGGFGGFSRRYCAGFMGRHGWDDSGSSNLPELHNLLRQTCYVRRNKKDVLTELPPVQRNTVALPITNRPEYKRAADDVIEFVRRQAQGKADFLESLAELDEAERKQAIRAEGAKAAHKAEAAETLVRLNALRQITARGKQESIKEWVDLWLEESEGKLIISTWHKETTAALQAAFPEAASITSEMDAAKGERQVQEDRFQNDPNTRLMILPLNVGGIGLTLTAATAVAFAELPWRPGDVDQAEGRAYGRLNDAHGINSTYLVGEDTVDEWMAELIDEKRGTTDQVNAGVEGASGSGIMASLVKRMLAGKPDEALYEFSADEKAAARAHIAKRQEAAAEALWRAGLPGGREP